MKSTPATDRDKPPLLTDAEFTVLVALEDLTAELGYAPTFTQLLARIGWSSKGTLHRYLARLRAKKAVIGSGRATRAL